MTLSFKRIMKRLIVEVREMSNKDNRGLFRVRIKGFKELLITNSNGDGTSAILNDSSGSGLSFLSSLEYPLSKEEKYLFHFELEKESFIIEGTIIRKALIESDRYTEYGVAFTPLSSKEECRVIRALNRHEVNNYRFDN